MSQSTPQPATASAAAKTDTTKNYELRVPKGNGRKVFVSKFSNALKIDFGTWKKNAPDFAREGAGQNVARASTFVEVDAPKVGAGSEFGKDKRDEARRKKYTRRARSDDVPWIMNDVVTNRKYRGTKEGGVQDNSSYYIFTTVDGRIEAYPVSEWFNFTPVQRYNTLNEDEAEEAFEKRDKVFNYFNIMYQKRLKATNGEDGEEEEEAGAVGKASGSGTRRSGLKINDDDDDDKPGTMSDSEEERGSDDGAGAKKPKAKGKKKGKPKAPPKKKKKNQAEDNDAEPAEDSDDGDFETRELDYETSSSEDEMEDVPEQQSTQKGIDEEIEEMQDAEEDEDEEAKNETEGTKDNSNDDQLANSDSDNDEEDIDAIADSRIPSKKRVDQTDAGPSTPSDKKNNHSKNASAKGTKRKQESGGSAQPAGPSKKVKNERSPGSDGAAAVDGKLDEEALVRQYLTRKPITSKELLRKLTKRGVRTDNLQHRVGEIIKRLNPEKTTHAGKLMLHLKT
ncbi:putative General transcription factor IIF subunit 1 [Hypsibius exemplaris]|uniref:Transcription initiation factor IIF subunit alpha n=1 Tax=Hypsibius exemplaris TaxID=2072580 RepID=A0A9X6RKX9_HYPEX|nr:putative General transcription factor IIF subunit 1 [Hypsibius exemplaris]